MLLFLFFVLFVVWVVRQTVAAKCIQKWQSRKKRVAPFFALVGADCKAVARDIRGRLLERKAHKRGWTEDRPDWL